MRTLLALATLALLPTAAATGYLVNVGIGSSTIQYGINPFGGSGDALDVGLFNAQCSDEADVVDVGVMNAEGRSACSEWERCEQTQGSDPLGPVATRLIEPSGEPTPARCTDDGDTVDVSILSTEGGATYECPEKQCYEAYAGDANDATDISVGGVEYGDQDDGNDVGVLNCEWLDESDSTDLGVLNQEWYDASDTFDLGILNVETNDQGDLNGLNVGGASAGIALECHVVRIDLPVGPSGPLLP